MSDDTRLMVSYLGKMLGRSGGGALLAALLIVVLGLPGCRKPPPLPPEEEEARRRQNVLLTHEGVDRRVGEDGAERVKVEMGIHEHPELTSYIQTLGSRLVIHAPDRSFDYQFQIVDQDVPNAFALPGGFIYVSRGLLALSNSEDELANVIGHEITHVAARHAAGRQVIAQKGKLLGLPGAVLGTVFGKKVGEQVANSITVTNPGYIAAYSRAQENAADRAGQKITSRAGFDPAGMVSFLQGLEGTVRLTFGRSRIPGFFDTHPSTPQRAAAASSYAQTINWERQRGVVEDHAAFLAKLDGLTVGENPAEGVIQDGRFLHSDLGFSLQFPEGWEVQNTRRAVAAESMDGKSTFILELDSDGDDPEVAANQYALGDGARFGFQASTGRPIRLGHLRAFRLSGKAIGGQGPALHAEITFVAFEGRIYRMIGATQAAVFLRHQGSFRSAARSFRALSPQERQSIAGEKLRIVVAQEGESLTELTLRTRNSWSVQKTAVMNGLFAKAELREGQLIKIARKEPYVGAARATSAPLLVAQHRH